MNSQDHNVHRQHPTNQQLVIAESSQMAAEECEHFLRILREKTARFHRRNPDSDSSGFGIHLGRSAIL